MTVRPEVHHKQGRNNDLCSLRPNYYQGLARYHNGMPKDMLVGQCHQTGWYTFQHLRRTFEKCQVMQGHHQRKQKHSDYEARSQRLFLTTSLLSKPDSLGEQHWLTFDIVSTVLRRPYSELHQNQLSNQHPRAVLLRPRYLASNIQYYPMHKCLVPAPNYTLVDRQHHIRFL